MLNRKISNYLFYFFLVAIVGTVFAVRTVTIGGINDKIADIVYIKPEVFNAKI